MKSIEKIDAYGFFKVEFKVNPETSVDSSVIYG
jgi:hypothetical protein